MKRISLSYIKAFRKYGSGFALGYKDETRTEVVAGRIGELPEGRILIKWDMIDWSLTDDKVYQFLNAFREDTTELPARKADFDRKVREDDKKRRYFLGLDSPEKVAEEVDLNEKVNLKRAYLEGYDLTDRDTDRYLSNLDLKNRRLDGIEDDDPEPETEEE